VSTGAGDTSTGGDSILANRLVWAKEVGIDEAKFKECLTSPDAQQAVEKSMSYGEQAGANSTPTFFVGSKTEGKKVAGAQPFSEFKKIIDEEQIKNLHNTLKKTESDSAEYLKLLEEEISKLSSEKVSLTKTCKYNGV
jgi:hypothetical protein